jgi:transcription elongation factor
VQNISKEQDEYKFCHKTYKSGLVIKHLPPTSVAIAEVPVDIGPFVLATYISNLSFYSSIRSRNTQDTIKVGHQVKVVISEPQGAIGCITDVTDGVATVTLQADDIPPLVISLHALSLKYSPGDHIMHQFSDLHGILSMVDKDRRKVTLVVKDTNKEVCTISSLDYIIIINIPLQYLTHMDSIEPYSPPRQPLPFHTRSMGPFLQPTQF